MSPLLRGLAMGCRFKGIVPFLLLLCSSCQTLNTLTVNPIPSVNKRRNLIKSQASTPIVLGIPFGTSFVEAARSNLVSKCRKGEIEGVMAKFQSTSYFFVVVHSVSMQGYCLKGG